MSQNGGFDGKLSPPAPPAPVGPPSPAPPPGANGGAPALVQGHPTPMAALAPTADYWGAGVPQAHSLAIAALVCGIAALASGCCCSLVSVPVAMAAIGCGVVGLSKIRTRPDFYSGTAMCVIGIVLGASSLAYVVLSLTLGLSAPFLRKLMHP